LCREATKGDLVGLASGAEALVIGADDGIAAGSGDRAHVQDGAPQGED
jgi:hypothetical protein